MQRTGGKLNFNEPGQQALIGQAEFPAVGKACMGEDEDKIMQKLEFRTTNSPSCRHPQSTVMSREGIARCRRDVRSMQDYILTDPRFKKR